MLKNLLKRLGLRPTSSIDEFLAKYSTLDAKRKQEIIGAYLSEDLSSNPAEAVAQLALNAWKRGDRRAALQFYDAALAEKVTDSVLRLNRGNLLFEMGRFEEAASDFEKARNGLPPLPDHVFVNHDLIQMLGVDSEVLRTAAERRRKGET